MHPAQLLSPLLLVISTLESGIDIAPCINIAPLIDNLNLFYILKGKKYEKVSNVDKSQKINKCSPFL